MTSTPLQSDAAPIQSQLPWYKHGWLWFVMLVPLSAVAFGVVMVISANYQPDDLVVDNYYKEGMGINLLLEQDNRAQAMQASVRLSAITPDGVVFDIAGGSDDLSVSLFHVSDASLDLTIELVNNGNNIYTATSTQLAGRVTEPGIWYLEVNDHTNDWRLKNRIQTPLETLVLMP